MHLSEKKKKKANNAVCLSAGNSTFKLNYVRGLSTRVVCKSVERRSRDAEGWWAAMGDGDDEG